MPDYNECHIINSLSGHIHSADCWCEPAGYWQTGEDGQPLFVIEHLDNHDEPDSEGLIHKRKTILFMRERDEADWLTRFLNRFANP